VRRSAGVLLASWALLVLPACAHGPAQAPADHSQEPSWADVFEGTPELLVSLRPHALRADPRYGPLLRQALEEARARSGALRATPLDAVEDAEQVVVGVRASGAGERGESAEDDAVLVIRGVPASLDPLHLWDGEGHGLWKLGPDGAARELVREHERSDAADSGGEAATEAQEASLFELPGRTWVIATGAARLRARSVFAHPLHRPELRLPADSLAAARLDGPSLVNHLPQLRGAAPLAALGHHLRWVGLELPPGSTEVTAASDGAGGGRAPGPAPAVVRATLSYMDSESAAVAELTLRELTGALSRAHDSPFSWLARAEVTRAEAVLTVVTSLPFAGKRAAPAPAPAPAAP
jgi:hypothetical protein